jgi:hypothetical protein
MKTIQETIYQCDHCGRKMFNKGAMSWHEKWCKENPNNKHKCFDFCIYLEMNKIYNKDEYGNNIFVRTDMLCKRRKTFMYSFKLEKNRTRPVEAFNGLERMPLECELFKNPGDEIQFRDIEL